MDASVDLVRRLLPMTVNLHVTIPASHPSAAILGEERMGSGAVVDPSGLVLTVNYVTMGARAVRVTLVDGTRVPGQVVARDFESGLCVVKIAGRNLPCVPMVSSGELGLGAFAFIIASTGLVERRVAGGVVSYLGPFDAYWEYLLERSIKLTCMNPGFGGGPCLDLRGRMVGITSLNLGEPARYSLAIPVEQFLELREELLEHGGPASRPRRPWLGVYAQGMDGGILVSGLVPNGPAEAAGLKEGDVILEVDREEVASREELYRAIWKRRAGEVLTLTVARDDRRHTIEILSADRAVFYA
jgi:S1-C subfamily serine protease